MSNFLRKASLKVKGGSQHDLADIADGKKSGINGGSGSGSSSLGSKPPKSRSASAATSISINGEDSSIGGNDNSPKRKPSITKRGKKRLSSLFSSSSLSSFDSDKPARSSSPAIRSSPLNLSTSSSGTTTPTQNGNGSTKYASLPSKGHPPHPDDLSRGVNAIALETRRPLVSESPEAVSPIAPVPPSKDSNASPAKSTRPESLYSQWDLDEYSSDEEDVFRTPTEGLSDIGEGEEDDEVPAPRSASTPAVLPATGAAAGAGAVAIAAAGASAGSTSTTTDDKQTTTKSTTAPPSYNTTSTSTTTSTDDVKVNKAALDAVNVSKGATASSSDVCGTGPSTIRRTQPVQTKTRVKPRSATKAGALAFDQEKALGPDVDMTREVLRLFLTSQMKEAEDLCYEKDKDGSHLYLQSAHGYIQALKGMMTFDADDLQNALEICRNIHITATALRKQGDGIMSRVGGLVRPGAGVQRVKQMTLIERHAELVYAESSLMKAMLAIVAGGDWMGLIKEALNMRSAHGTYHTLQQFIDQSDKGGYDEEIDMDFRSGVALGTGTSSLMLSLLPGKVLKIAEVFGYAGDRTQALATLMSSGGWTVDSEKPAHDERDEGLRRPVCDLILLAFHLVISLLMPVAGVDISMARKILDYNNRRYPDGIFFLYFTARLHTAQCEPQKAIDCLQRALDLQLEYVQLQHMCLWDYALDYTMINNWKGALDCFSILREESNWSRAVYTYSAAACLVELVADNHPGASLDEADKLMKTVRGLTKKLAGKSLPIEKLCVRKTRKFESQGHYLFLPGLELAYVYGALYHTPRKTLLGVHLPRVDRQLERIKAKGAEAYEGNYWDDYCLAHFLRGVCLATSRYQPSDAIPEARARSEGEPEDEEIDRLAEEAFNEVVEHGPEVQLDHYILYHNHFELGKLHARRGDKVNAQKNFDHVMNGQLAQPNRYEAKTQGKYSLEGALLLKTHSAIQALKEGRATA